MRYYSLILLIQLLFLVFKMMVITIEWFISLVCLTRYVRARYWNLKMSKLNGSVFVTIVMVLPTSITSRVSRRNLCLAFCQWVSPEKHVING